MKIRNAVFGVAVGLAAAFFFAAAARAEYVSSDRQISETESFDQAIDLNQYRKGNPDWDTQELIASGFKALHQENIKILAELKDLRASLEALQKTTAKREGTKQGYKK